MPDIRVVLDTNVLVSGIAYPSSIPGKILAAWRHGAIEVLLSEYILDELARVLPRLRHRHDLDASEMADLIDTLRFQAELVEPASGTDPALRDANDQPVLHTLSVALEHAQADYLITGDKDLLALAGAYPIITPAAFWQRHAPV